MHIAYKSFYKSNRLFICLEASRGVAANIEERHFKNIYIKGYEWRKNVDFRTREILSTIYRLLTWNSLIGRFVHPVGG